MKPLKFCFICCFGNRQNLYFTGQCNDNAIAGELGLMSTAYGYSTLGKSLTSALHL